MKLLPSLLCVVLLLFSQKSFANCKDTLNEVLVPGTCTKIQTFKSDSLTNTPVLVIALHGDAPFNNPSYQYKFASLIAESSKNTVSVGMLRPGYTDHLDRTSDGIKGKTVGDNYDKPRLDQIAAAIEKLKQQYNASKVILAGHSGGSAITAKIIAVFPQLVNYAFVVSCPCNVNAWRSDMTKRSTYKGFIGNIDVVSPVDLVEQIDEETVVSVFIGNQDNVTKPYLSEQYVQALKNAGISSDLYKLDGDHKLFLHKQVIASVKDVITNYNEAENQKG